MIYAAIWRDHTAYMRKVMVVVAQGNIFYSKRTHSVMIYAAIGRDHTAYMRKVLSLVCGGVRERIL